MAHVYLDPDDRDPVDVVEWWAAQARGPRPVLMAAEDAAEGDGDE